MSWMFLSDECVDSRCRCSYEAIDDLVPQINVTDEFISALGESVLRSEELCIPEVFVLIAHADAVSVFAIEAEAKLIKLWKSVNARNFTVEDDMSMTFVTCVSCVFQVLLAYQAEWILVFLNWENKLLAIFKIAKESGVFNQRLAVEE